MKTWGLHREGEGGGKRCIPWGYVGYVYCLIVLRKLTGLESKDEGRESA